MSGRTFLINPVVPTGTTGFFVPQTSVGIGSGGTAYIAPWSAYGGGFANGWTYHRDGLVVVDALIKCTGANFTQDVIRFLPVPVAGVLLMHFVATVGASIYNTRFDLDARGAVVFNGISGFPNGSAIDFVPLNFAYQAAVP